ncbi:MAG: hypothetical protein RIS29_118 [Bacteroidota bacterium]|jgi:DNA-binding CsgD family transcriptional regulator
MKSFISNVIPLEECKQVLDLDINISYVYDVDSQQVICMNKSASQFFGVTNEDLADIHNRFIVKYVHPEDFTLLQGYRTYLDSISGSKFNLIIKYRRHDGEYKWMYTNTKPVVLNANGYVRCLQVSCIDLEETLQRPEKKSVSKKTFESSRLLQQQDLYSQITPKERMILKGIAEEKSSGVIAKELNLSVKTVNTHRNNILKKLNTKSSIGVVKHAIMLGIV